jgi:hypothetical protein
MPLKSTYVVLPHSSQQGGGTNIFWLYSVCRPPKRICCCRRQLVVLRRGLDLRCRFTRNDSAGHRLRLSASNHQPSAQIVRSRLRPRVERFEVLQFACNHTVRQGSRTVKQLATRRRSVVVNGRSSPASDLPPASETSTSITPTITLLN